MQCHSMSISAAGLEGQPQGVQPLHHPAAQACLGLRQGALQEEHHAEFLAEIEWRCVMKIWEKKKHTHICIYRWRDVPMAIVI